MSPDAGRMILPGQQAAIPVLFNSQICQSAQPICGTLSSTHQSFGVRKLANGLHATAASGGPLGMIWLIVVPAIGAPIAWQQSTPFLHSGYAYDGIQCRGEGGDSKNEDRAEEHLARVWKCVLFVCYRLSSHNRAFIS